MRRLFTNDDGRTRAALRWGEQTGEWRRADMGVWAEGPEDVSQLDRARARVMAAGGVASHHLAGVLHGLDAVPLDGLWVTVPRTANGRREGVSRRDLVAGCVVTVGGIPCTDGIQTLLDLAPCLSDTVWEQALESALRKRLTSVAAFDDRRNMRVRRVLDRRPAGAPATESLLETLMVSWRGGCPDYRTPCVRLWIEDARARLDQAWPELGLFVELDGQHHKDQPVYDARRETAVVAATGWLCGRFTWTEVTRVPHSTARRLGDLAEQARRRPVAQPARSSSATR